MDLKIAFWENSFPFSLKAGSGASKADVTMNRQVLQPLMLEEEREISLEAPWAKSRQSCPNPGVSFNADLSGRLRARWLLWCHKACEKWHV